MIGVANGTLLLAATVKVSHERLIVYATDTGRSYLLTVNKVGEFRTYTDSQVRFSHFIDSVYDAHQWLEMKR